MAGAYAKKTKTEILRTALQKVQSSTPITSIGPGSVARALAESVVNELGDFYASMDFNTAMGLISTAQGRALDLIGELYNVQRKQLGQIATIDQSVGTFYFYLDEPYNSGDITIPEGTAVTTANDDFIGQSYGYRTNSPAVIAAGRTRVYVGLTPQFLDSVYTAGTDTLTQHSFTGAPGGVIVRCRNPKPIAPQQGFESDQNYRARIVKAVRVAAGGTTDAIRFAGLGVPGVREVRMRPSIYGLGSVEALVVAEDRNIAATLIPRVNTEMQKVKPAGVRLFIREPDYAPLTLQGSIVVRKNMNVDKQGSARRAEIGILRYLNTLLPGDMLSYSRLIQAAMDASDSIADVSFSRLRLNGTEILRNNHTPESDQQIIPGNVTITAS